MVDAQVALRGGEAAVAEDFLNVPQVGLASGAGAWRTVCRQTWQVTCFFTRAIFAHLVTMPSRVVRPRGRAWLERKSRAVERSRSNCGRMALR